MQISPSHNIEENSHVGMVQIEKHFCKNLLEIQRRKSYRQQQHFLNI